MELVIIESPFAKTEEHTVEEHITYARRCLKDCLQRGEAPYASHLLYTQEGVLDDLVPGQRKLGMDAGFAFRQVIKRSVVYTDYGISGGVDDGLKNADFHNGHTIEYRSIGKNPV